MSRTSAALCMSHLRCVSSDACTSSRGVSRYTVHHTTEWCSSRRVVLTNESSSLCNSVAHFSSKSHVCLCISCDFYTMQGINGQFSVPNEKISLFQQIISSSHPSFGAISFNYGDTYEEGENREEITTFKRLSVKERQYILTDGLKEHSINWKDYGSALPAEEWHEEVKKLDSTDPTSASPKTILLGTAVSIFIQYILVSYI